MNIVKWLCTILAVTLVGETAVYAQSTHKAEPPELPAAIRAMYSGSGIRWVDLQIPAGEPIDGIVIERCRAVGDGNDAFGQVAEWDMANGTITHTPYVQSGASWGTFLILSPQKNSSSAVGFIRAQEHDEQHGEDQHVFRAVLNRQVVPQTTRICAVQSTDAPPLPHLQSPRLQSAHQGPCLVRRLCLNGRKRLFLPISRPNVRFESVIVYGNGNRGGDTWANDPLVNASKGPPSITPAMTSKGVGTGLTCFSPSTTAIRQSLL